MGELQADAKERPRMNRHMEAATVRVEHALPLVDTIKSPVVVRLVRVRPRLVPLHELSVM